VLISANLTSLRVKDSLAMPIHLGIACRCGRAHFVASSRRIEVSHATRSGSVYTLICYPDCAATTYFSQDQLRPYCAKRPVAAAPTTSLELAATTTAASTTFNSDQGPGPGPIGPGPGCNLFPAPASFGTTVPLSYFGPPPSDTNRSLVGPVQLLDTGVVDVAYGTITLPLYLGHLKEAGRMCGTS
jgi:hypothetical protein